jgi:tetratricopeptide (TPR) repeat protein
MLKHIGRYEEAIPYFEQCLEIKPEFEAARKDLAACEREEL